MSVGSCESVRDALPLVLAGRPAGVPAGAVEAHLAACDECRAEARVLELLRRHPMGVPAGLERRIAGAVRQRAGRGGTGVRPYALAAGVAAAFVAGALLLRERPERAGEPAAAEPDAGPPAVPALWPADGTTGASAALARLDELSVEQLESLLAELEP